MPDFITRKQAAINFVNGILPDQLVKLEQAIASIKQGHGMSKHFRVLIDLPGHNAKAGQDLVLEGHGWANPDGKGYVHPFLVSEQGHEVGEINLTHSEVAEFIEIGFIRPLD